MSDRNDFVARVAEKHNVVVGKAVKPGDVLSREEASKLPDGSRVVRIDGPKTPYKPLQKTKGLWHAKGDPRGGGLGTADWEVLRVGPGKVVGMTGDEEMNLHEVGWAAAGRSNASPKDVLFQLSKKHTWSKKQRDIVMKGILDHRSRGR